jgi:putative aminopeptidase FrvX
MDNMTFLKELLSSPGPSSFETKPAALWREQAKRYGATTQSGVYGNSFATFNPGGKPKVMLAGHIDEIGLMITHIDKDGFLYFSDIGMWDAQQLVGQRVRILSYTGQELLGVIGKNPSWQMLDLPDVTAEQQGKASQLRDLWIDIGASSGTVAKQHVRVGDVAVLEHPLTELLDGRIVSKAIDNRISAYIVLEAAKRAAEQNAVAEVIAVATVQEEIGLFGAKTAAYQLEPDVALAVDVTFATDTPHLKQEEVGEVALGSGANFSVGSVIHRGVLQRLIEVAEHENLPYTLSAAPKLTWTDADEIAKTKAGIPTAVVSVPNRYMHSPNEMVDPKDVETIITLISSFIKTLNNETTFLHS